MASVDAVLSRLRTMVAALSEPAGGGLDNNQALDVIATGGALCAGSGDMAPHVKVVIWEVAHQLWCVAVGVRYARSGGVLNCASVASGHTQELLCGAQQQQQGRRCGAAAPGGSASAHCDVRPRAFLMQLTSCDSRFPRRRLPRICHRHMLHASGAIDSPDATYMMCYFATKARPFLTGDHNSALSVV